MIADGLVCWLKGWSAATAAAAYVLVSPHNGHTWNFGSIHTNTHTHIKIVPTHHNTFISANEPLLN